MMTPTVGAATRPARTATAQATIAVSSTFPKVTGDVLVLYRDTTDNLDVAKVSGSLSGLSGHPVVELWVSWFPFKGVPVEAATSTPKLSDGKGSYSFDRTPSSATKYFVKVVASAKAGAATVATSSTVEVYVTPNISLPANYKTPKCARPICTISVTLSGLIPPADAAQESAKYLYSYLGLNLNAKKEPPPPTEMKRYSFKVHKTVNTKTGEVTDQLRFSFSIGDDGYYFEWDVCTQDTLTVDGLGLPGHHDCGDATIPYPVPNHGYLG
ncbi:MAG: hypothetical protein ABSD78_10415 [Acidimicrobiales bacterium]|jgi:hypothetical protein